MSNTIDVKITVDSNVHGTECFAMALANVQYDTSDQVNVDAFREFIIDNMNETGYEGIVRLTSVSTNLNYHSGKGEEKFAGTLTQSFADLNTLGQDIVVQADYTNFVYAAMRHGLNKTIWNVTPAVSDTFIMAHAVSTQTTWAESIWGARNMILFPVPMCYLITEDGNVPFDGAVVSDTVLNNVVMSSHNGSSQTPGGGGHEFVSAQTKSGIRSPLVDEFFMFRMGAKSKITGFFLGIKQSEGATRWSGYNFVIRSYTGKLPEFDEAIDNNHTFNGGTYWSDYSKHAEIMAKFEEINTLDNTLKGLHYDFTTNTTTDMDPL